MKISYFLLLFCLCCTSAVAQKIDFVEIVHDGIAMTLKRQGEGRIEIVYAEVPVQLREVGVQKGTILVSGQWGPDQIMTGSAYMFTKECGPLPYSVRGMIELDNTLTIVGPTPQSCEDQSLHWNDKAVLRFTPPPRQLAEFNRPRESRPEKKPKPKPRVVERRQEAPRRQADQWNWREQWRW